MRVKWSVNKIYTEKTIVKWDHPGKSEAYLFVNGYVGTKENNLMGEPKALRIIWGI